jgi:hypothetical protein
MGRRLGRQRPSGAAGADRTKERSAEPVNNASRIIVLAALLIGAGVLVVLRQILIAAPNPQLGGLAQWMVGTEFPGPIMIVVGAFLLCVGSLMRR